MRLRLEDIPEAARGRVAEALGKEPTCKKSLKVGTCTNESLCVFLDKLQAANYPKGRMNESEMRFFDLHLRDKYKDGLNLVLAQQVRIPLPGGGVYIPDFVVYNYLGALMVYEVKGGYRGPGWEQGYERFKRAAAYLDKFHISCYLAEWRAKEKKWVIKRWTNE